jgi:tetratricopeptide (TPR) repeat protein
LCSVASFFRQAASTCPLLVILEDLHDADKGTLDMLTYIARHLEEAHILLLGTYRDITLDQNHPLSATLGELMRLPHYGRITLRGLTSAEVAKMVRAIAGGDVDILEIAEAVYQHTEGNPLFVQESVRNLAEAGLLLGRGEKKQSQSLIEIRIPDSLRDVVGTRLNRLSTECNRILQVASVIGHDFQFQTLRRVSEVEEDALYAALEEAIGAAVIGERTSIGAVIQYRFAHAFFRQLLYEKVIAPRRVRLHQQVAIALEEQYAGHIEDHAAELAEHFSHSSDSQNLEKAINYGEMAAHKAEGVYAYGEAARLWRQTLEVQEILDLTNKPKRCDLLLCWGNALRLSGQPRHVVDFEAPAALTLAEELEDQSRAVRSAFLGVTSITTWGGWATRSTQEFQEWISTLDRWAQMHDVDRVIADGYLAIAAYCEGRYREAEELTSRALKVAREIGDDDAWRYAASLRLEFVRAPQRKSEGLYLAEELAGKVFSHGSPSIRFGTVSSSPLSWYRVATILMANGMRDPTEQLWDQVHRRAELTGQLHDCISVWAVNGLRTLVDGDLGKSEEIVRRITSIAEEGGISGFGLNAAIIAGAPRAHLYLGHYAGISSFVPDISSARSRLALCLAYEGREEQATEILNGLVLKRLNFGSLSDETPEPLDANLLETAILLGYQQTIEMLVDRLADSGSRTTGQVLPTCIGRHLGAGCVLLGRYDEARTYYGQALETATQMRFRPEIALTRLGLAVLLLDHYPEERSQAIEHLDFAIGEFQDMKMEPALRQALKRKEILKA